MDVFLLVFRQMLVMFTFVAIGFALRKTNILPDFSSNVISKLETFVFVPCLNLFTMLTKCTVENFKANYKLIFLGLILLMLALLIAYPLSRAFVRRSRGDEKKEYLRNIYKYILTFGNFGFMGNYIILSLFGQDGYFKYTMFVLFPSIVSAAWGMYVLTPKKIGSGEVLRVIKDGLLKPPVIAVLVGIVLGLLNVGEYIPSFALTVLEGAGDCMGPCAMILAGVVIGGYNLKELVSSKKVYIASLLRLILIPSAFALITRLFISFNLLDLAAIENLIAFVIVCFATPIGMYTIVFPAAYGGDTKTGASAVFVSTLASVITIPLMYYFFTTLI